MEENFKKKIDILNYWIDVEASTPPLIKTSNFTNKGDSKWNQSISFERQDDILWNKPLVKNLTDPKNWLHKVFLGIFNTKHVIEEFSLDDLVDIKSTHDTCLVSFLVDSSGIPIKNSIQIPDYLKSIALTTIEKEDQAKLFDVRIQDTFATWTHSIKSNKKNVNSSVLNDFLQKILVELNWEILADALNNGDFKSLAYSESINLNSVKEGSRPHFETNDITSSLIVNDLKNVKKSLDFGIISPPLFNYLSEDKIFHKEKIDVIKDKSFFKEFLDIDKMPIACWPLTHEMPLVSSQQFAVNTIFGKIESNPIISVNGPPGTGKTTLLKDVIANIIFKRAESMLKFKNDPKSAFKKIGETSLKINSKTIQDIFQVDSSISGHEIVVASSNNRAIEKITKELPLKNEIAERWHKKTSYLSEISNNINEEDSWGLISASLGNKNNNYNFYSKFLYSKVDENGATKSIFDYLKNPNYFLEERLSWSESCQNLEEKIKKVEDLKKKAKKIKNQTENFKSVYDEAIKIKNKCEDLSKKINKHRLEIIDNIKILKERRLDFIISREDFEKNKTSFFKSKEKLDAEADVLEKEKTAIKRMVKSIEMDKVSLDKIIKENNLQRKIFEELKEQTNEIKTFHEKYVLKINQEIPFDDFWSQSYTKIQKSSPWYSIELNDARIEVFIASLNIHKSFMIENSQEISSNLNAFKQVLNGSFNEDERLTRAVWETLFLVVPVVSTTFSSFDKLFGDLLAESIGWLLIDEAGQATPQAPVGALWRSEKAVIIGDPLQVQPVIQIENKLSDVLLNKNNVEKYWSSTMLSSQEIADRQNPFGTIIDLGEKKWVGIPLRVHRRCDEPMFSISNKIAYNNTMIFGKKRIKKLSDVEKIIGRSKWFDVKGEPENDSHWINDEGLKLIEILNKILLNENQLPNLYIITPFKNVAFEIKRMLKRDRELWCPSNVSDNVLSEWLNKYIGTIHSFQGEETDSVILVLGGNIARPSAISWVCDEPNILNVAVTRAKNVFYIIGNKTIWNKGVFSLLKGLMI